MQHDLRWLTGQKMLVGFSGTEPTEELRGLIRREKVGNIILFRENIVSAPQLRALCDALRELILEETGLPPLIAIDQEGGAVSRLPADCAVTPSAMALAASGRVENALLAGRIIGRELTALGVNMNLAPVMDVNSNPDNPVIGARSFGDDPATVSAFGVRMIRGLRESGVLSCAKHFPGHGDTAVDSHLGLPVVTKTLPELEACELPPFRAAVEAGVDAVMTAHILFPALEAARVPATMSRRIVTGLLRERLGFSGLIVSDCLMMDAIAREYGVVEGGVAACEAGVDVLCVSHSVALAGEVCRALRERVAGDVLAASAERMIEAKRRLPPPGDLSVVGCEAHRAAVNRLREEGVTQIGAPIPPLGERPFFVGCRLYQASRVSDPEQGALSFPEALRARLGGTALVTSADPDEAEIARAVAQAKDANLIVLGTYQGHVRRGQLALARALAALMRPMVCVALRDPVDLAGLSAGVSGLAVYEYSAESLALVARVLRGEVIPRRKAKV